MIFPIFVSLLYGLPLAALVGMLALALPFVVLHLRRATPAPVPATVAG